MEIIVLLVYIFLQSKHFETLILKQTKNKNTYSCFAFSLFFDAVTFFRSKMKQLTINDL